MSHTPTNSLSPISKLGVAGPASTVMSPIEAESPLATALSPEPHHPSLRPRRGSNQSYASQLGTVAANSSNSAAQHLISDILSTKDAALKEKATKATSLFSTYIQTLFNDASMSLYQVTDLVHKKLPKMMEEKFYAKQSPFKLSKSLFKKVLQKKTAQLSIINSDLDDAGETLSTLSTINALVSTQQGVHRAILAANRIRNQRR